jgi:sortase A
MSLFFAETSRSVKRLNITVGIFGLLLMMVGLWVPAKAVLAQVLIERAWQQSLGQTEVVKPWPWMDTWPVARLQVPEHDVSLLAMHGLSGQALAFGPGLQTSVGGSDSTRTHLIAGHNDTHFRFVQDLQPGDMIQLDLPNQNHTYRVDAVAVLDVRDGAVRVAEQDQLLLVTCYPFNVTSTNGPLRYVVTARLLAVN